MFKTLLLATVVGVGAANAAVPASELAARSNNPPSYLCSNVNKKCSGPKAKASVTAYCSSLLKATAVTKTKRVTTIKTSTTTKTKVVATITQPASVVTSTVTSCGPPTTTPATSGEEAGTEARVKREAAPPQGYGYSPNTVHKPSCLSSYKKAAEVTSACKCVVSPSTTTVTSTIKMTAMSTSTVSATSTITGAATTTYVFPVEQNYEVADQAGRYYLETVEEDKFTENGRTRVGFEDDSFGQALLFQLNNGNLVDSDGRIAAELADEDDISDNEDDIKVVPISSAQIASGAYKPITCDISYDPTESVCPLVCQYSSPADRNLTPQSSSDSSWFLGPPNTVDESNTYKTFAVSPRRGRAGRVRRTTRR